MSTKRPIHHAILGLQSAISRLAVGDPSGVPDILKMHPDQIGWVLQLDVNQHPEVLMSTIQARIASSPSAELQKCSFVAALCWLDIIEAVKSSDAQVRNAKMSMVMSSILYGYMDLFGLESQEYRKVLEAFEAYPGFEYQMLLSGLPVENFNGEYASTLERTFGRLVYADFK